MKTDLKFWLIATTAIVTSLLPFSPVTAGTNVNESDNSILCKGTSSCNNLKTYCAKEGGSYTPGVEDYGKCNLPAKSAIDDFKTAPPTSPQSSPKTPVKSPNLRN